MNRMKTNSTKNRSWIGKKSPSGNGVRSRGDYFEKCTDFDAQWALEFEYRPCPLLDVQRTIEQGMTNQFDLSLWSDDPSTVDLLSFDAVAATAADALLDDALDPLSLGLSGPWGSGKTTVLGLIATILLERATSESRVIVVRTDPWRYDPNTGAKESLISDVLSAIENELSVDANFGDKTKKLLKRLSQRVDWSKAIKLAAKTSLALQIPSFEDLTDLVKDSPADSETAPRGMEGFGQEFQQLMSSEELGTVQRVVVLVDDLDRCLDTTIVETLEAIRLFLSVKKMSFVIAADENRVADAIRSYFPPSEAIDPDVEWTEEPARLYLHKIVQTTIPVPALSRFDTEAYIILLKLQARFRDADLTTLINQCAKIRMTSSDLDELVPLDGIDMSEELAFALRLTPMLYEKLRGSPRRIKRFLNDLHVRQSIALRRGINLESPVVAKLMLLEVLLPADFKQLLEWLANGILKQRLDLLELSAGRTAEGLSVESPSPSDDTGETASEGPLERGFNDSLLRWAKIAPSLADADIAAYLNLAASFKGTVLLDKDLPERLRDIASNLLSSIRAEQRSVSDSDISALTKIDAETLIAHLCRMARDRPPDQTKAVMSVLRIFHAHADVVEEVTRGLLTLPPKEIAIGTPLLFKLPDDDALISVLTSWKERAADDRVKRSIDLALGKENG